jgi:sterol desaturase/sphingolipid hydroxylase (fatty acid hydroxylase superfamily)
MFSAYYVVHILGKKRFFQYKIWQRTVQRKQIIDELKNGLKTFLVFAAVALLVMFMKQDSMISLLLPKESQSGLNILTDFLILFVVHDFYFYWMHRAIHSKKLFKRIHYVHHRSIMTTPFTSFSFHPSEALLESIFFPIILLIGYEWEIIAIAVFLFTTKLINIIGHLGYDFFHDKITNIPILNLINTATIHDHHHIYLNKNFGLYTTIWDRIFGTFHKPENAYYQNHTLFE